MLQRVNTENLLIFFQEKFEEIRENRIMNPPPES